MPTPPLVLPAAEFTPDLPDYQNPGSGYVRNVIPRTPQSYGPLSGLSVYSGALSLRCQGADSVVDSGGNVNVFAGDASNLYRLTSASINWANASKSAGAYSVGSDQMWRFAFFNGRIIAVNIADPAQGFLVDGDTKFSDLANGAVSSLAVTPGSGYTNGTGYALTASGGGGSGFTGTVDVVGGQLTNAKITNGGSGYTSAPTLSFSAGAGTGGAVVATVASIAPKARYIAVVKDFVVVGNTSDPTYGTQPQRVWWCAANDPTNWPTPGTAAAAQFQSDYNDLFGEGGWVQGIVGNLGGADGAVFMERAVWRMVYSGPPNVFDFLPAEGVRGTPAPGSIVQLGALVYYLGEDGFYAFDGSTSVPIGANKVDKYFFSNLDQSNMHRIVGTVDPINKLVIWACPFLGNTGGDPNVLMIYNWQLNRWSIADLTCETILRSLTFGYTLDTLPYTLDTLPAPLDSRIWTGGSPSLVAFDTSHKLNFFTGPNLAPTVETSEGQAFPGRRALARNARPLVDGGTPSVAIGVRDRLEDSVSYNAGTAINSLGTCPQRASGRYMRARITLPAGSSFTNIQGVEIEGTPQGYR